MALLLGVAYGLCLAAGLTLVGELTSPTARGALTGTFYACAYLGFGGAAAAVGGGRRAGFVGPLAGLTVLTSVVAAALALPVSRRLAVPGSGLAAV